MTIQECHIDFLTKLQEQATYQYQHLEPEAIDWLLYEHQYRYLRSVMDAKNKKHEGFEWTQGRLDEIESLMTTAELDAFVKDSKSVFSYLPWNYFRLINDSSVVCNCCTGLGGVTTTKNLRYSLIPYTYIARTRFQLSFDLTTSTKTYDSLTRFASGVSIDLAYVLVSDVLEYASQAGLSLYWESYGDLYYPNTFIAVHIDDDTTILTSTTVTSTVSGPVVTVTNPTVTVVANTIKTTTETTSNVDNRLLDSQISKRANKNPFMRTKKESPISTIERGRIIVDHQGLFDVYGLVINYIRAPRKVSLALNIGLEIGTAANKDDIHRRIVDMAVETTAARIRAGNLQLIQASNINSD